MYYGSYYRKCITWTELLQLELYVFGKYGSITSISREENDIMCGRYYVDDETAREIEKLVREVDRNLKEKQRKRDVYPEQQAAVIHANGSHHLKAQSMVWGFPGYKGPRSIINARSETVLQRRMFRESALHRRCIIPARGFYEWDPAKNKVSFMRNDEPILFMAGLYDRFQEQNRFVILTTQANASVQRVHDRMPLIMERSEILDWILDDHSVEYFLHKTPVLLDSWQEYEQQMLL